jgi:hypothetical protein
MTLAIPGSGSAPPTLAVLGLATRVSVACPQGDVLVATHAQQRCVSVITAGAPVAASSRRAATRSSGAVSGGTHAQP